MLHNMIGDVYLKLGRRKDAERAYRRAVEMHPENAEAHLGLSTIYRRRGLNQETIDEALTAVGYVYRLPMAHLNLGIALARSGDADRAIDRADHRAEVRPATWPTPIAGWRSSIASCGRTR